MQKLAVIAALIFLAAGIWWSQRTSDPDKALREASAQQMLDRLVAEGPNIYVHIEDSQMDVQSVEQAGRRHIAYTFMYDRVTSIKYDRNRADEHERRIKADTCKLRLTRYALQKGIRFEFAFLGGQEQLLRAFTVRENDCAALAPAKT